MAQCCSGLSRNTGYPSSFSTLNSITGFLISQLKTDAGVENFINLSALTGTPLDVTVLGFKAVDPSARLYQIGDKETIKEVVPSAGDAVTQTFSDQSIQKLQNGVQSFTSIIINVEPKYIEKIDFSCKRSGIYLVDDCGNLIGRQKGNDNTKLYPIPLESGSIDTGYNFAVAGTSVSSVKFNFSFSRKMKDSEIAHVSSTDVGVDLGENNSILDAILYNGIAESVTETTISVRTSYGAMKREVMVTGLVQADFAITNNVGAVLAVSSVVEDDGIYTITHATSTGATPVTVALNSTTITKGYEMQEPFTL